MVKLGPKIALFMSSLFLSTHCLSAWSAESEKVPITVTHSTTNLNAIIKKIAASNEQVKDLSADVSLSVQFDHHSLPFRVDGSFYYKQPDKMKLKLHGIPDFLSSHQNDAEKTTRILAGLRRNMGNDFDSHLLGETRLDGRSCYWIQLIPKTRQAVLKILLWVDKQNYTMPQVMIWYDDGTNLIQRKTYTQIDGVNVVQSMKTDYADNKTDAEITASFSNYQINKGIPDKEFGTPGNTNPLSIF